MNDKAREAFEREYEAHLSPAEADWFRRDEGDPEEYYHATTADAWWGFRAALQWAASQQAAEGWISVKERLPAPWKDIDIALSNGRVHCGTFCGLDLQCFDWPGDDDETGDEYVTHWRERPAAPTAQGERDE